MDVLGQFDKEAIIPSPLYQEGEEPSFLGCTYDDATLSNLDFKIDDATITPADGELTFDFEIDDFSVYVNLKSDDLFGACPDAIGTLSAEKLEVNGAITLSVDLGTPSSAPQTNSKSSSMGSKWNSMKGPYLAQRARQLAARRF